MDRYRLVHANLAGYLGYRKRKRATNFWLGFDGDLASPLFDDTLTNGQSNSGARVFRPIVQSFEDPEDTFVKLRFDANPVVLNGKDELVY